MKKTLAATAIMLSSFSLFGQETHEACLRRYRLLSDHSAEVDRLAGRKEREQLATFLERIRPGIFGPPGADSSARVRLALVQDDASFPLRLVFLKTIPSTGEWTLRRLVRMLPITKNGEGTDLVSKNKTFTSVSVDCHSTTVLLRAAFEFPHLVVGIVGKRDKVLENPQFNYRVKAAAESNLVEAWMAETASEIDTKPLFSSYARRILQSRFGAKP